MEDATFDYLWVYVCGYIYICMYIYIYIHMYTYILWLIKDQTNTGSSNSLLPRFNGRCFWLRPQAKSQVPKSGKRLHQGLKATKLRAPWLSYVQGRPRP